MQPREQVETLRILAEMLKEAGRGKEELNCRERIKQL
jgi:hypothetical protein